MTPANRSGMVRAMVEEHKTTALAILTIRNEAAFLLDWIAHHKAVGFDRFVVFSNDCRDGTDLMLDRLAKMGHVDHHPNPGPYDQRGIQFTALKTAAKLETVRQAAWIMVLDIDEFVNIHTGDGTLGALHQALPEATAIPLTWRLFGNAGQRHYVDQPIPDLFTRAAPLDLRWPWRTAMFKTLYRNDGVYRKPGVHRPRDPDKTRLAQARWFDGEGREMEGDIKTRRIFSHFGRSNHALAQLNHYPLGAMESFILKADRGRVNRADQPLGMDYWVERNWNTHEDTSIARYRTASTAIKAELMQDRTLHDLHSKAVSWRKTRFHELLKDETSRALFGRLLMTPPSEPLPAEAAQFLLRHAMAAQSD